MMNLRQKLDSENMSLEKVRNNYFSQEKTIIETLT